MFFSFRTYFNPLPPHGGRHRTVTTAPTTGVFQSTPSAWRETARFYPHTNLHRNFNPLPPHGGRQYGFMLFSRGRDISIHSLRMEGDDRIWLGAGTIHISIHSLRMEGDDAESQVFSRIFSFQSTPSAWRETAKLHRKAFFISPILVQSCKKGCKRLHSAPEKMVFFEKREKNLVRNLQHLSVRL